MEIPRHWRLKAQRYRLEGSACPTCGRLSFPPRLVCPHCSAQPLQITDQRLLILLLSVGKAEMDPLMRYQITEKMIG